MKKNRTTTCYVTTLYFFLAYPIENYFPFHGGAYLCYVIFRGSVSCGNGSHSQWPSKKKKRKRSLEGARMCAIWRKGRKLPPPSDLVFPSKERGSRGESHG